MSMLKSLQNREAFIKNMMKYLESKYDLSDTQIFIFGSFLTEEFIQETSDIDIGVYSENETKMYDIKIDLELYLNKYKLQNDIVIMHLSDKLWINIPIMVYGKQQTSYESERMFNYLVMMLNKYGFNPVQRMQEAV